MRSILVEFNELSPVLMDKFLAAGKLPNFARLRAESEVWLTDAQEDQSHLEPWIQWVTVHSGLSHKEHGITYLGEGDRLEHKNLWDLMSDAGKPVLVCGSMNINYRVPLNGVVLPDPWSRDVAPYPADELRPYFRFISKQVQEYTRDDPALSRREQAEFVLFMLRHGLSPSTVGAIAHQLIAERTSNIRWKRAVLLDRLQWDLFHSYWKRQRPEFATFFLNSTAHFQHVYWRNMEPEHFKIKPGPDEQAAYQDAILFGYEQMDRLCGRLLRLAGDDTALIFATALSQQPCLTYEETGGKTLYKPRDFQALLRAVGITDSAEAAPIMAEEFHLTFESEEKAQAARSQLKQLRYRGREVLGVERRGADLLCGCRVWEQVERDAVMHVDGEARTLLFDEFFYRVDILKSGMHHPDGMLWVRTPQRKHVEHSNKLPLTALAPMILSMHGLEVPAHMHREMLPA